ncbi:response regulator transcription factor [Actinoplanes philippinensis]|uniref:response regulator transcription factor n=1 Tax=Actinoplanes philippinensis TaxID=35752 RepID=UPI0033DA0F33
MILQPLPERVRGQRQHLVVDVSEEQPRVGDRVGQRHPRDDLQGADVAGEHRFGERARELLADGAGAVGYLLKDRVLNGDQFTDAVRRVAAGGTAMDPQVIAKLLAAGGPATPLSRLTAREREVLELMAQGRSNTAIAQRLFLSDSAVSKNIAAIFTKLGLPPSDDDNRRVMAVLTYLNAG